MSRKIRRRHRLDGATSFEIEQDALRRIAAQMKRLGTDAPVCSVCGETEFEMIATPPGPLLQEDHELGRHEGMTRHLCLNDHAKRTARQLLGASRLLATDRTEIERIAALLCYRGQLKIQEAEVDVRVAEWLIKLSEIVPREQYVKLESPFPKRREERT